LDADGGQVPHQLLGLVRVAGADVEYVARILGPGQQRTRVGGQKRQAALDYARQRRGDDRGAEPVEQRESVAVRQELVEVGERALGLVAIVQHRQLDL